MRLVLKTPQLRFTDDAKPDTHFRMVVGFRIRRFLTGGVSLRRSPLFDSASAKKGRISGTRSTWFEQIDTLVVPRSSGLRLGEGYKT